MNKLFAITLLLLGSCATLPAQAFVQISSVRARPEVLTCVGPGATTIVRVQVYLAAIPDGARGATATAQLAVYSAHPSVSKMDIRDANKEFSLSESPALLDFEVNCTADTLPGEITLAASISAAPDGIAIKEPTSEPAVHLKIERPK